MHGARSSGLTQPTTEETMARTKLTAEDRAALRVLSGGSYRAYEQITYMEVDGLVPYAIPELCRALVLPEVTFFSFSCLGTLSGKEELRLDLAETYFFKSRRKWQRTRDVLVRLAQHIKVRMHVILPDCEPRRTWGWQIPQDEITGYCDMMRDEGIKSGVVPEGWQVPLWSEIEAMWPGVQHVEAKREEVLCWAAEQEQSLMVHHEAEHMRGFRDIQLVHSPKEIGRRQVAAYAYEGMVLGFALRDAVLIQSEMPVPRKDLLYQPLRYAPPLPVVHPLDLSVRLGPPPTTIEFFNGGDVEDY